MATKKKKKTTRKVSVRKKRDAPIKMFRAWSYSRFSAYDNCPSRANLEHLVKPFPVKKSPALVRGTEIHDEGESYLSDRGRRSVPESYRLFSDDLRRLRRNGAIAEASWAFDRNWAPLDDFFDNRVWVRMKVDAHTVTTGNDPTVHIVDFKTGKVNRTNHLQLDLYAVGGFLTYPRASKVLASFWYLDQGEIHETTFTRAELDDLKDGWERRTKAMLADTKFKPRPSHACRWCPYSKAKGGPCEF